MQQTPRDIAIMEQLLRTLLDLINFFPSRNSITNLAKDKCPSLVQFGADLEANNDFIHKQAVNIYSSGLLRVRAELVEYLLWFVYAVPLGRLCEFRNVFARHILGPIHPIYEMMFKRLVAEFGMTESRGEKYVEDLMKTVYWIERYNEKYCQDKNLERVKLNNGVYSLYLEQINSPAFARLCLGICANINSVFAGKIEAKLSRIEAKREKARVDNRDEIVDISDDMKSSIDPEVDGHNEFNNAIAITRKILQAMGNTGTIYAADTREFIKNNVREYCIGEGYIPVTIEYEMKWTDDLFKATDKHKTLWCNPRPGDNVIERKLIDRAVNDIVDDDAPDGDREAMRDVFCGDNVFEDVFEGVSENIPIEDFKKTYLGKYIKEKLHLHHIMGGLLRVVYCWDNKRVMMSDKLCLFLGFVLEKAGKDPEYDLAFNIFIESLLVGTSYKNIILGRIDTGNMPGMPMGVFFSAEELAGGVDINKEHIEAICGAVIREFRDKYVSRKMSSTDIVYTSRAWATDKTKYLTIDEQALVCGNIVPGTRADLFYVVPSGLIESFTKSGNSLLDWLIKYLEFCGRTGKGLSKDMQNALLPRLLKAKADFQTGIQRRRELWEEGKPHIVFTDDETLKRVMTRLLSEIGETDQYSDEYFRKIETAVMFLLILTLCLREQEARRIRLRDISRKMKSLVIIGKQNRAHFESRIVILVEIVYRLLDSFIRLRKRAERFMTKEVRESPKADEIFIFPDEVSKELSMIVKEVTDNPDADADSVRKYAISYMHNNLIKPGLCSFEDFQAIIGHVFAPGYEKLSPFNYSGLSNYESIMNRYAKTWETEIECLIRQMEALWK